MSAVDHPSTCLACGRNIPQNKGRGRKRQYCNATCRSAARRGRAAHVNEDLTHDARKDYLHDVGSGGSPLDAVAAAREQARLADEALRDQVERARAAGHTWQEIGDVLGTSRQAAFQRFGRPIDPRTGADMARDAPPGAEERAVALIDDLMATRWEEVRRDFDAIMLEQVTLDRIAEAWTDVAGTVGRVERMGSPIARRIGDHTLVVVPLHCEAGDVYARITFNQDGTVSGLYLRPA
jgi:uncharacterized protein DUF3887